MPLFTVHAGKNGSTSVKGPTDDHKGFVATTLVLRDLAMA
jgi:hypothetical protein